eukprot:164981-Amphidinium_carterae.1
MKKEAAAIESKELKGSKLIAYFMRSSHCCKNKDASISQLLNLYFYAPSLPAMRANNVCASCTSNPLAVKKACGTQTSDDQVYCRNMERVGIAIDAGAFDPLICSKLCTKLKLSETYHAVLHAPMK